MSMRVRGLPCGCGQGVGPREGHGGERAHGVGALQARLTVLQGAGTVGQQSWRDIEDWWNRRAITTCQG